MRSQRRSIRAHAHNRQRFVETLEPRQMFCASVAPSPDPYINLYDYDGNLLPNWQELIDSHNHSHDHGDGHNHDHGSGGGCGCDESCGAACGCPCHGSHDHGDGHDHTHTHGADQGSTSDSNGSGCGCDEGCGADCPCPCHGSSHDHGDGHTHTHSNDQGGSSDTSTSSGCGCDAGCGADCPCPCHGVTRDDQPYASDNTSGGSELSPAEFNAAYKWPQSGGVGSAVTITYSYSNLFDGNLGGSLNEAQLRAATEEAFNLWATYAPLNFVEVVDSGPAVSDDTSYLAAGTPNIRIGHHAMDGASGTLAHAYYPSTTYWGIAGDVHMDTGENWKLGAGGGIDFVEVMTHEIGHALGLGHESTNSAIMNPYYGGRFSGLGTGYLIADDINGIRALYGTGTGSVTSLSSNTAPTLAAIDNVTMAITTDTTQVTLSGNDADGDSLTYSASLVYDAHATTAYNLDQQHGFVATPSDYYNARGMNERYFGGDNSQLFYILPTGAIYQWGGSVGASSLVGTLSSDYHADLNKVTNATAPTAGPSDVSLSVSGNVLTVNPNSNFAGTIRIIASVSDSEESASQTFDVNVVNQAPTISNISDQTMSYNEDTRVIAIPGADGDGHSLTYTATAAGYDSKALLAYQLDQTHGFYAASSDYYNFRGHGEKYFLGNGGLYFILGNGGVYQWNNSIAGSTLLGTLDSTYHANLATVVTATQPVAGTVDVNLSVSGSNLTIDPASNFLGTFVVTVTANDGISTASANFTVNVVNHAPTIADQADINMGKNEASRVLALTIADNDGDSLTITPTAVGYDTNELLAYQLDQAHGFYSAGSDYYNFRGHGERYFLGNGGSSLHFILGDGAVYTWAGSIAGSTLLGTLDSSYSTDLSKLLNAPTPTQSTPNVTLSMSGNNLTIDPANGYLGTFTVTVSVTDGTHTVQDTFNVTVANNAPTLGSVSNQTMSQTDDTRVVALSVSDSDGDSVALSATAAWTDPTAQLAYQLDQTHLFASAGSDYYNFRGLGERYFVGNNGSTLHFILANGAVYTWGGSMGSSTLLGTLDASYNSDLSKLLNAQQPAPTTPNVNLSFSGNNLTIDPDASFSGTFDVTVRADDGTEASTRTFSVTVTPSGSLAAPVIAAAQQAAPVLADTTANASILVLAGFADRVDSFDGLLQQETERRHTADSVSLQTALDSTANEFVERSDRIDQLMDELERDQQWLRGDSLGHLPSAAPIPTEELDSLFDRLEDLLELAGGLGFE